MKMKLLPLVLPWVFFYVNCNGIYLQETLEETYEELGNPSFNISTNASIPDGPQHGVKKIAGKIKVGLKNIKTKISKIGGNGGNGGGEYRPRIRPPIIRRPTSSSGGGTFSPVAMWVMIGVASLGLIILVLFLAWKYVNM